MLAGQIEGYLGGVRENLLFLAHLDSLDNFLNAGEADRNSLGHVRSDFAEFEKTHPRARIVILNPYAVPFLTHGRAAEPSAPPVVSSANPDELLKQAELRVLQLLTEGLDNATQDLPQIALETDGDAIIATGVMGLICIYYVNRLIRMHS